MGGHEQDEPMELDYNGDYEPRFHGFHDLMRFHVKEILLVSSLYDAFILEEDGRIGEQLYGEYKTLELTSPPRVIRVPSGNDALAELKKQSYDLIITVSHLGDLDPFEFGKRAKEIQPNIPVVLLVTDQSNLMEYHVPGEYDDIDRVFFWSGDATLFLAIIKWVEDQANVDRDASTGLVGAILIIENSSRYYSMFLPLVYSEIMRQTSSLVAESLNEHEKFLRRRARPKILLAETYEEAMEFYSKYKGYLLGLITDVSYPYGGGEYDGAGFKFIEAIGMGTPALIQSSHPEHGERAQELGVPFLDKNSPTLLQDLRTFFTHELGFGDFKFRLPDGTIIAHARDMKQLGEMIKDIPDDSIDFHGRSNHFSSWLMARGEIRLALSLRIKKVTDFKTLDDLRNYLIEVFKRSRREKQKGIITDFTQQSFEFEGSITRFGTGSLGGKGRGIAFLSTLLSNSRIRFHFPEHKVKVPDTLIISTEEFDKFMDINGLQEVITSEHSDGVLEGLFCDGNLSHELKRALRQYLSNVDTPIAVRSSSLLEDSQNQPFAGIYSTYILPNNDDDSEKRLRQLAQAIKMVYASAFSKAAKAYIQTTVHTTEEEKMGIAIQKLVGNRYGDRYYPVFSGVAQSRNFYPVAPLTREDGMSSVALGLGNTVVDGSNVLSFSPNHPKVIHGFTTPGEVMGNSQHIFHSLNMGLKDFDLCVGENVTLLRENIADALGDGTLDYLASTYDPGDERIRDSVDRPGPKVITFAPILKYDTYPLAKILRELLGLCQMGMGRPVEMEFAVSFNEENKLDFYALQVRPLVAMREKGQVVVDEKADKEDAFIFSSKALGNGVVEGIEDIVLVHPDRFDKLLTHETAAEVGEVNSALKGRPYLLIGPGRWGTRDRFLGIPVEWDQISGARAMVEFSMEDFRIDPSQGSHFFHNMTSLGISYFTVPFGNDRSFIDWEWLKTLEVIDEKDHVVHLRSSRPIVVKVDGRSGRGVVLKQGEQSV